MLPRSGLKRLFLVYNVQLPKCPRLGPMFAGSGPADPVRPPRLNAGSSPKTRTTGDPTATPRRQGRKIGPAGGVYVMQLRGRSRDRRVSHRLPPRSRKAEAGRRQAEHTIP